HLPLPASPLLLLQPPAPHRDLHSFPTRRSSDLRSASTAAIRSFPAPTGSAPWPRSVSPPRPLRSLRCGDTAPMRDRISPSTSARSEEHTSELQSLTNLVCRLLLEKKKTPQQPLT